MKAVLHTSFGPPEELTLIEIPKPKPGPNEILIKVINTSVTSSDCNLRNLTYVSGLFKWFYRIQLGLFKPKTKILGIDVTGIIESVGELVTKFSAGDQVFGTTEPELGAYAEYVCLPDTAIITRKPKEISWNQIASLTLAGTTALHFLRDLGKVQQGQEVLINGASGAVGSFAVQIAKCMGTRVTGVCSTSNVALVGSLGADEVIDYKKSDFTENLNTYDVIFDAVSKSSFKKCKKALKKNGKYLVSLPTVLRWIRSIWVSMTSDKSIIFGNTIPTIGDINYLKSLMKRGALKSVIDRTYKLDELVEAFKYVEKGHKKGNVVIIVNKE